jgi:D-galactose 1-dehydrogenase
MSADLVLSNADDVEIAASFDFMQTGTQTWEIEVETDRGRLHLLQGGSRLSLDGNESSLGPNLEYPSLYAHFAGLADAGRSDVDVAPLRLVADAFLRGRRETVPPFVERPASRP